MIARVAVMGAAHVWERPNLFSYKPGDEADKWFRRSNRFNRMAAEVDAATNRVAMANLSVFSKFEVAARGMRPF